MIVLPDAENRTIVSSFVWTKHPNVRHGRTDGQISCGYYSGRHCEQCGRAVKMLNLLFVLIIGTVFARRYRYGRFFCS